MSVEYTSRTGKTSYLHEKTSAAGKTPSRARSGALNGALYEVRQPSQCNPPSYCARDNRGGKRVVIIAI